MTKREECVDQNGGFVTRGYIDRRDVVNGFKAMLREVAK